MFHRTRKVDSPPNIRRYLVEERSYWRFVWKVCNKLLPKLLGLFRGFMATIFSKRLVYIRENRYFKHLLKGSHLKLSFTFKTLQSINLLKIFSSMYEDFLDKDLRNWNTRCMLSDKHVKQVKQKHATYLRNRCLFCWRIQGYKYRWLHPQCFDIVH